MWPVTGKLPSMPAALLAASCSSVPCDRPVASHADPSEVRIAGKAPDRDAAELVFERISGRQAVSCPALIYVDGTLRADIAVSETVSVPVEARLTNVRIKLRKFCGAIEDRLIALRAKPGTRYTFRIGFEAGPEGVTTTVGAVTKGDLPRT